MCFLYTLHVCQLEMMRLITNNTHALSSINKCKNPFANELRVSRNLEQRGSRHWQVSNGCLISQFSNESKNECYFLCFHSLTKFTLTFQRTESECSDGAAAASTPADIEGPSTSNDPETPDGNKDGKKKKNRCLSCKKKVGLTGESDTLFSFLSLLH